MSIEEWLEFKGEKRENFEPVNFHDGTVPKGPDDIGNEFINPPELWLRSILGGGYVVVDYFKHRTIEEHEQYKKTTGLPDRIGRLDWRPE